MKFLFYLYKEMEDVWPDWGLRLCDLFISMNFLPLVGHWKCYPPAITVLSDEASLNTLKPK